MNSLRVKKPWGPVLRHPSMLREFYLQESYPALLMKIRQNSLHASSRGTGKATILRHAPRAMFSVTRPELKRNYFSSSYLIWEKGNSHFRPSLAFDMKRNAQFQSCLAFLSPIRKAEAEENFWSWQPGSRGSLKYSDLIQGDRILSLPPHITTISTGLPH